MLGDDVDVELMMLIQIVDHDYDYNDDRVDPEYSTHKDPLEKKWPLL